MWSKCLTFCSEMPPFQSKSFGDVFITFRSPKVLPTSTQPAVECSYFRRPARVHHIQNTACGFSLHLQIGYSSASLCKCPPECIVAALPSSNSLVDPGAKDCHCLGLKGYSNFYNFHPNKSVTVMCSCYKLYYFEPRNIS